MATKKSIPARLFVTGGVGSNQTVATEMHAKKYAEIKDVQALLLIPQGIVALFVLFHSLSENFNHTEPEMEGAMNAYSSISLSAASFSPKVLLSVFPPLLRALYFNGGYVSPPGGACVPGAIGHIAAVLETTTDTRFQAQHIVLPFGSGCTTSGILLGIAVAQKLGLGYKSFKSVHSVCVIFSPLFPDLDFCDSV
jgi:1-aminocyclopropane-1-carboxylate deaminase/D-cysteine desulfhydrase-like pyridoxal-dependent ACC family enzyme